MSEGVFMAVRMVPHKRPVATVSTAAKAMASQAALATYRRIWE